MDPIADQVGQIISGTVFSLVGLSAAGIAIVRRGKGVRILIWLAFWSGMYGTRLLIMSQAVADQLPPPLQIFIPYLDVIISYLIVVIALLAWVELTRGKIQYLLYVMIVIGLVIGIAGIGRYVLTGAADAYMIYNNLLAACTLLTLLPVVILKRLSEKFLLLPNRGILAIGTLIFAAEALYSNLSRPFGYQTWPFLGWLGFAVLLFSLAYVAVRMIFANERRLLAIDNELETARQIQASILPSEIPSLAGIDIAAAYYPMTAVAGDFYDFIPIDQHRTGFLMADVSGHGVPAALIASMIKVAIHSVSESARDPAEVLHRLGNILGNQLHGQFVSASYLLIDTEQHRALYSAAGHPPLLYWESARKQVHFIESNGLLIGVLKETEYPVYELEFNQGDRFILYTDGLTEAENPGGEAFGDQRFTEVVCTHQNTSAGALGGHIIDELHRWQKKQMSQQDDITWIIIDVL